MYLVIDSPQIIKLHFLEQKITEIEILQLLTDREIDLLVSNIGDKIRLKRGISDISTQSYVSITNS